MLTCSVPLVWPELVDLEGAGWANPLPELLTGTEELLGLVCGVNTKGIAFLEHLLTMNPGVRCNLVVAVYPGCPTRQEDLLRLLKLQAAERIAFGVVPLDLRGSLPPTMLYAKSQVVLEGLLAVCGTPNFGFAPQEDGHGNVVMSPDLALLDRWCIWFEHLWKSCHPLTETACGIPETVWSNGHSPTELAWAAYRGRLLEEGALPSPEPALEPTAEVVSELPPERPTTLTEQLRPDPLLVRLTHIYEKGDQVCADRSRRLPPFSLPIRPELFGLQRSRRMDVVKRNLSYSITPFDGAAGDDVARVRRSQAALLGKLGFILGDGRYWVPHEAKPLLLAELERLNETGKSKLAQTVGDLPRAFVEAQRQRIVKSLTEAYQEFRPDAPLKNSVVEHVMEELVAKVEGAIGKDLLAPLTFTPLRLREAGDTKWVSPWAEAYGLLYRIAEFPRRVLSRPGFLKDMLIKEDQVLKAMDVCSDHIVHCPPHRRGREAAAQLNLLEAIDSAEVDDRTKCVAVLQLVDTGNDKEVLSTLDPRGTP